MDLLGRSKLPQVELNEDELNALSGLGKVDSKTGLSYNPYKDINPEFLKLTEEDDDDWLYMSVSFFSIFMLNFFIRVGLYKARNSIWFCQ